MIQMKLKGQHVKMPQQEQSSSTYGRYEEQQAYTQQQYGTSSERPSKGEAVDDDFVEAVAERIVQRLRQETAGKVYPQPRQLDKNLLRISLAIIALLLLVLFAFLFVIVVGGSTGWISFAIGSFVVFLIVVATMDKIK
jgi:Fe2+ transport system protein B